MKTPTVALAMIVKNEEKNLARCIESVIKYVDEIRIVDTGSTDRTVEIAKKYNATVVEINAKTHPDVFPEEGIFNFAQARNVSFEDIQSDWILWLDADDILQNAAYMKDTLVEAEARKVTAIGLQYLYAFDNHGQASIIHTKDRFLKNGMYQWEYQKKWALHENVYPKKEFRRQHVAMGDKLMQVFHLTDEKGRAKSNARNRKTLEWMIKQPELENDPRVVLLYARQLFSDRDFENAEKWLMKYLDMETLSGDAMMSCIHLAMINEEYGQFDIARTYSYRAITARPDHPMGYVFAAKYTMLLGYNHEALQLLEDASRRDVNNFDGGLQAPTDIKRLSLLVAGECFSRLKDFNRARAAMSEYLNYAMEGEVEGTQKDIEDIVQQQQKGEILKSYVTLNNVEMIKQADKVKLGKEVKIDPKPFQDILDRYPDFVKSSKEYANLKKAIGVSRKLENHVTIFCTMNFEEWDPKTIIENGGGGSETAVIEMASGFAKEGYTVEVYANPPIDGTVYNKVTYRKMSQINFADNFDIFISWRNPYIFKEFDIDARKKFLWLQDIMMPQDYTIDLIDQLDKIIVLSTYHRFTAPHVKESKFYYTTNGINLKLIEEAEKEMKGVPREAGYCIYASSADRGLDKLIDMVPAIKKAVKGYRQIWYYGWYSWNKLATSKEAKKWKRSMIDRMKKYGLIEGGRIGKKDLYKEYFKANVWTYPLVGLAETSCITAMEAQACGAIPVTTGITALEETQQFGIKVPLDQYQKTLIEVLQQPHDTPEVEEYRQKMMKWARETFNWEKISKAWVNDLFKD